MNENKQFIGEADWLSVSLSEEYEVEAYVAHYLHLRGYADSKENKNVLARHVRKYPQRGIVQQDALTDWLDALLA